MSVCAYCESPATQVDHVFPRSKGGRRVRANLVPACRRCNNTKRAKIGLVYIAPDLFAVVGGVPPAATKRVFRLWWYIIDIRPVPTHTSPRAEHKAALAAMPRAQLDKSLRPITWLPVSSHAYIERTDWIELSLDDDP